MTLWFWFWWYNGDRKRNLVTSSTSKGNEKVFLSRFSVKVNGSNLVAIVTIDGFRNTAIKVFGWSEVPLGRKITGKCKEHDFISLVGLANSIEFNLLHHIGVFSKHSECDRRINTFKVNSKFSTWHEIIVKAWDHTKFGGVSIDLFVDSNHFWRLKRNIKGEIGILSKSINDNQVLLFLGSCDRKWIEFVWTLDLGIGFEVETIQVKVSCWSGVDSNRTRESVCMLSTHSVEINELPRFSLETVYKRGFGIKWIDREAWKSPERILWF
mmetsp:Transcript_18713/g.28474  ORF Transcript_18713/g.28474 Transcript_18713/m.28474 type:complete len:268 (+) Transcript_18713:213-1016(+)